ncbi:MAG: outer membrane protein assembly factor BamE [Parvibaculum sp.]
MTSNRLHHRSGILATLVLVAVTGSALSGCGLVTPVTAHRGYIINESDLDKIKPHEATKEQVERYMGTPSVKSTIDGEAWYYISSNTETYLFYPPEETERQVVAVYFDKTDEVQDLRYYGMQDGEIIDMETRFTPSRGKELTILGQLFSNLGRFNKDKSSSTPKPGGQR